MIQISREYPSYLKFDSKFYQFFYFAANENFRKISDNLVQNLVNKNFELPWQIRQIIQKINSCKILYIRFFIFLFFSAKEIRKFRGANKF